MVAFSLTDAEEETVAEGEHRMQRRRGLPSCVVSEGRWGAQLTHQTENVTLCGSAAALFTHLVERFAVG
jgi:hypothetical protein